MEKKYGKCLKQCFIKISQGLRKTMSVLSNVVCSKYQLKETFSVLTPMAMLDGLDLLRAWRSQGKQDD